jgi:hypothetical protein
VDSNSTSATITPYKLNEIQGNQKKFKNKYVTGKWLKWFKLKRTCKGKNPNGDD